MNTLKDLLDRVYPTGIEPGQYDVIEHLARLFLSPREANVHPADRPPLRGRPPSRGPPPPPPAPLTAPASPTANYLARPSSEKRFRRAKNAQPSKLQIIFDALKTGPCTPEDLMAEAKLLKSNHLQHTISVLRTHFGAPIVLKDGRYHLG